MTTTMTETKKTKDMEKFMNETSFAFVECGDDTMTIQRECLVFES